MSIKLKIATWNIGGGFTGDPILDKYDTEDISYFCEELKKQSPDIICLQECHTGKDNEQPQTIANALEYKYIASHAIAPSHLKEGPLLSMAIISKYPIASHTFHQLRNPNLKMMWRGKEVSTHDKGVLESVILVGKEKIRILCGHMVPFHKFKSDFMTHPDIRNQLEQTIIDSKLATIFCVDLNYNDEKLLLSQALNAGFNNCLPAEKTSPEGKRFDKIILSPQFAAESAKIIPGIADHYLCVAQIRKV